MKLAVIGATGGTGIAAIELALDRGHEVVAVARRPDGIGLRHDNLEVRAGNVYDPASLANAFEGVDAVLSALGRGGLKQARKPSDVLEVGTGNVIRAMQQLGIERLVTVSSVGTVDDPTEELVYRYVIKKLLRQLYEDMARMEGVVAASNRNWTIVRPPFLTDGPLTGRYCVHPSGNVPYGYRLSRRDLAFFAVDEVTANKHGRAVVGVSYPSRRTPPAIPRVEMAVRA